jgi:hypothetical protein
MEQKTPFGNRTAAIMRPVMPKGVSFFIAQDLRAGLKMHFSQKKNYLA